MTFLKRFLSYMAETRATFGVGLVFVIAYLYAYWYDVTALVWILLGTAALLRASSCPSWDRAEILGVLTLFGVALVAFADKVIAECVGVTVTAGILFILSLKWRRQFPDIVHIPTARICALPVFFVIVQFVSGPAIPAALWPVGAAIFIILCMVAPKPWVYFEAKIAGIALFFLAHLPGVEGIPFLFLLAASSSGSVVCGKMGLEILRHTGQKATALVWLSACGCFLLTVCLQLLLPVAFLIEWKGFVYYLIKGFGTPKMTGWMLMFAGTILLMPLSALMDSTKPLDTPPPTLASPCRTDTSAA